LGSSCHFLFNGPIGYCSGLVFLVSSAFLFTQDLAGGDYSRHEGLARDGSHARMEFAPGHRTSWSVFHVLLAHLGGAWLKNVTPPDG
jgi:hypothetical protein